MFSLENCYQNFLDSNPYPRELTSYDIAHKGLHMHLMHQDKLLINFCSNDYLGLAKHPLLISRSQEYAEKFGVGAASSRLVCGNFSIYEQLENQLAKALNKPAALILGTGYQANISVLEALLDSKVLGQKPLVFCDKLCHASMLTSIYSKAHVLRFKHNDLNHLETLLNKYSEVNQPKFILAESVYSMEGDSANLPGLIELAKRYHTFLYIDDAHAVGVCGKKGWGVAPEFAEEIDIIMGTFSKGLGSFGAYIGCSVTLRNYLVNKCKGLIYSTGLSPAILGAISAAIEILPQLENERQKLIMNANKIRHFFQQNAINYGNSNTHILPWIIGDAKDTLRVSQKLTEMGVLGTTIRPPSVPTGLCRIRFCLSSAHSDSDIQHFLTAIQKVCSSRKSTHSV